MTEYTRPQVTIDLAEYNELLGIRNSSKESEVKDVMDYDKLYSSFVHAILSECTNHATMPIMGMGGSGIAIDIVGVVDRWNKDIGLPSGYELKPSAENDNGRQYIGFKISKIK